jgi:mannan endo-1,6-alpha-mannosidase
MFARKNVLSLLLPFFVSQALGQGRASESDSIQVDVTSPDSIKSAAKQLASGIITAYNQSLAGEDGVPGLFEGFDDAVYFWEAGTVWNAMLGYSYLTGDSKYDGMISEALQFQIGDYKAYMPQNQTKTLGNDDQSCWGLAAMTAAEVGFAKPKDGDWVDLATNVWQTQAERYKNSWSNGNFFLLSARLAKFTGNATYSQWADKTFKWSQDVGLVDENFHVYDGTDSLKDCKEIQKLQWSAVLGLYTEGAALMYNLVRLTPPV